MDYILIADTFEKYQKGDIIEENDVARFVSRYPYAIAPVDAEQQTPQEGEIDEH